MTNNLTEFLINWLNSNYRMNLSTQSSASISLGVEIIDKYHLLFMRIYSQPLSTPISFSMFSKCHKIFSSSGQINKSSWRLRVSLNLHRKKIWNRLHINQFAYLK